MNQKFNSLPNALPGWTLKETLVMVDGRWTRVAVTAQGPQYPSGRWNKPFQGEDAEDQARAFMRERDGRDPADTP